MRAGAGFLEARRRAEVQKAAELRGDKRKLRYQGLRTDHPERLRHFSRNKAPERTFLPMLGAQPGGIGLVGFERSEIPYR